MTELDGVAPDSAEGSSAPSGVQAPVLELRDVSAGYGKSTVLRDVTLRVHPREVVALLGPNGAGKTTSMRVAAGTVRPSHGQIYLDGTDVSSWAPWRRTRAGLCLIPEGRGVFRSLTVRENLRLQMYGVPASNGIERALETFPSMAKRLNELAGRLSGGQQQMVALARAYITNPLVIMLDEPSMGLAPLVVDEVFAALDKIAATGVGMVLVEQYVTRAMMMASTVVLLRRGSVSYEGPPAGLDSDKVLRGYLGAELS